MLVQTSLVHTAQVRARKIAWDGREVIQHGLLSDYIALDLDAEWRECDRIQAVLAGAGEPVRILVEGGGFNIPSALMEAPGAIRMCLVGYVGETARIVTAKEARPLVVVESGEMGGADPAPEQPDLWARLMEEVRVATEGAKTAAQSATRAEADLRAAAERGDFDGEDGKTPVRGVDYWTAEDRKPIEDATLAALTSAGKADAAAKRADEAAEGASENILVGTETATVAHVEDACPAPLRELRVHGESTQDGTPTPEDPKPITSVGKAEVVVAGKNLLPRFTVESAESSGFKYRLLEDGGVEYNGVGNDGTSYYYPYGTTWGSTETIFTLQKGTYTVSSVKNVPMLFGMRGKVDGGAVSTIVGAAIVNPVNPVATFTLKEDTQIVHVQFTVNVNGASGVQYVNLERGVKATAYAPYVPPTSTPIDLQGHELRSLPNGVRDEVVVDRDGNANLIVRTKKDVWNCIAIHPGTGMNHAVCEFPDIGANYTPVLAEMAVNKTGAEIGICYVNVKMVYVTVPSDVTTPEQANELYGGMQVVYQLASPQTIPLGKVEVPALPESTSNVWNNDPVAAEVSETYVRDVNIAFSNLESKLTQAVVAAAANL